MQPFIVGLIFKLTRSQNYVGLLNEKIQIIKDILLMLLHKLKENYIF
jgi:hypothetical protein